jgi:hypothetical protein
MKNNYTLPGWTFGYCELAGWLGIWMIRAESGLRVLNRRIFALSAD